MNVIIQFALVNITILGLTNPDVNRKRMHQLFVLFVFVALRPKSTAMVITGRSVHLTTLFPGQA